MTLKTFFARLVCLLTIVTLTACASKNDEPLAKQSEEQYHAAAQQALATKNWQVAIDNLQGLEEYYPFGNYAEQAQLELIYAHHMNMEPEAAIAAADRFIRLHPQHHNVDYAYYMKGLTTFTEGSGLLERFMPTDMSMRDPGAARQSFVHFSQLLSLFPDSSYAPDARQRMIHLRNQLARYEIHAANYYMKRKAWVAASSRGRNVLETFPQTPAVPDALAVLIQCYHEMEMAELADNSLATLRLNYPEHPALNAAGDFNFDYARRPASDSILHTLSLNLFRKNDPMGFDSRAIYNPETTSTKHKDLSPSSLPKQAANDDDGWNLMEALEDGFDAVTFGLFEDDENAE